MRMGMASEVVRLDVFQLPATAIEASIKPKNMLPASPINMFALGKLYLKKPKALPISAKEVAVSTKLPLINASTPKKNDAIAAIPAQRPFILSIRLKAFVIPTIQRQVKTILRN